MIAATVEVADLTGEELRATVIVRVRHLDRPSGAERPLAHEPNVGNDHPNAGVPSGELGIARLLGR
jgi:hypothetical protein